MARIRSIHPSILTDPDLAGLPPDVRLTFIYSWIIADDAGNLESNPRGMKMAIFPGDDWATVEKITEITNTLIAGKFFVPYAVDGKGYLHIRNFTKYQKPEHPTAPRYPLAPGQVYAYHVRRGNAWVTETVRGSSTGNTPNTPRTHPEHTPNVLAGEERRGVERKGKEGRGRGGGVGRPSDGGDASPFKPSIVSEVRARIECGDLTTEKAIERLVFFGMSEAEAKQELGQVTA